MKEKRLLWQLTLLLIAFLSVFILWHLLIIFLPRPNHLPDVPVYITHPEPFNYTYPLNLLTSNDYNLLVNHSFSFNILQLDCNENTFLLILVHSSSINFKKRRIVRNTWGNRMEYVKLYFVIGTPLSEETQRKVKQENSIYQDLIQGNFLDVYRNLTFKHIMSLKYSIYHCPQAKYILKTDDDVFINMPLMKNFLSVDLSPFGTSRLLFCSVKAYAKVQRTYRSKWRVRFEEYPFRTYPTYCPGWAILYSPDIVFELYKSAQNTSEVFWIDDVHITGIVAAKNNIKHTDSTKFIISEWAQDRLVKKFVFPKQPFLFGQPDLNEFEIRGMWVAINTRSVSTSLLNKRELVS